MQFNITSHDNDECRIVYRKNLSKLHGEDEEAIIVSGFDRRKAESGSLLNAVSGRLLSNNVQEQIPLGTLVFHTFTHDAENGYDGEYDWCFQFGTVQITGIRWSATYKPSNRLDGFDALEALLARKDPA